VKTVSVHLHRFPDGELHTRDQADIHVRPTTNGLKIWRAEAPERPVLVPNPANEEMLAYYKSLPWVREGYEFFMSEAWHTPV
jgi:hypothetical protein